MRGRADPPHPNPSPPRQGERGEFRWETSMYRPVDLLSLLLVVLAGLCWLLPVLVTGRRRAGGRPGFAERGSRPGGSRRLAAPG